MKELQHRLVGTTESFRSLRAEWNGLVESLGIESVFLSWEWMYCWWETYQPRLPRVELAIILIYEGEELIGIIPVYCQCSAAGVRVIRLLGDQVETSLYTDFIYDRARAAEVIPLVDRIWASHSVDILFFKKVLENARCRQFEEGHTGYVYLREECPYVVLPESNETYVRLIRKSIRHSRKKLFDRLGARTVDLLANGTASIETLFDLHEKQQKRKNEKTRFQKEVRMEFHKKLVSYLAPEQKVFLQGIEHDSRIIAVNYGFNHLEWSYGYQMGYDFDYRKYSIGYQTILTGIESSIEQHQKYYDLSTGAADYKKVFSGEQRLLFNCLVSRSGNGKLIVSTYRIYKSLRLWLKEKLRRS